MAVVVELEGVIRSFNHKLIKGQISESWLSLLSCLSQGDKYHKLIFRLIQFALKKASSRLLIG